MSTTTDGGRREVPAILWHVTGRPNLASILEQGLRTDADGFEAGYVWGFDDQAVAQESADTGTWGASRDNVVIRVDVAGLDVIPDPHPGWGDHRDDHAWAVCGHVPADRVQLADPVSDLTPRS